MPADADGLARKDAYLRPPPTTNRDHLLSTWVLAAPLSIVRSAILDSRSWPGGWPGVSWVEELTPGSDDGLGNVRRCAWRSRLPYTLVFDVRVVRLEPLSLIEGLASGTVEGVGSRRLTQDGEKTRVDCRWDVRWNRDAIMRARRGPRAPPEHAGAAQRQRPAALRKV